MDRFMELLGLLQAPGDDGPPATIYDDLSAEYALLSENSGAKVAELSDMVEAKDREISRLKAMNYDLLMAAPASGDVDSDVTDESDDDDEPEGIDSLFESEDD